MKTISIVTASFSFFFFLFFFAMIREREFRNWKFPVRDWKCTVDDGSNIGKEWKERRETVHNPRGSRKCHDAGGETCSLDHRTAYREDQRQSNTHGKITSLLFSFRPSLWRHTRCLYILLLFPPPPIFFPLFFLISHGQLLYYYYPLSLSAERQRRETREMAKARISRIYTWSAEQLWSEFYVSVDLTNGQLTPNNNTPLLTQALSGTSKSLPFLFGFRSFMYRFINLSLHR